MKTLFFIAACLSSVVFLSCRKNSDATLNRNSGLPGKWTLVETLSDPGDGSGKWTPVDMPDYYFIQLNTDNSVETNIYGRWSGIKQYKVVNDSSLTFFYTDGTTSSQYYKISESTLTITGGCIEACGSMFVKKTP